MSETFGSSHAGFTHTYNIVKALSRYVDIKLFIRGKGKPKTKFDVFCVSLPSLKIENPLKYLKSICVILRETKEVDVIHERFHINPVDLLFVRNKKYVLEVNDPAPILYRGIKGKIYRRLISLKFKRADVLITQTETLKKILSRFYRKKIYVVPNGVDMEFFRNNKNRFDVRKRFGIDKKKKIVTFVGSFREWHGVQDIPKIAKEVNKKFKNVVFLLVGSGPLFDEVRKQKTKNMILTGPLPYEDIPAVLYQSDILIAPFNTKRFKHLEKYGFFWCPVKLYEYRVTGKPIISYDCPEIRKIVGSQGYLAKPRNLNEFIALLCECLRKCEKRAKKINVKELSWDERAKKIVEIYKKVME
ncbi:MAG: glycosyltransferase family 4 protein [Candidatus Aenigmarchaeota archaeon]|nr:glycosyltransferase family 4 protein [Candidatus Aenigmarchaeota archaeon]